jgi:hypothetical protein
MTMDHVKWFQHWPFETPIHMDKSYDLGIPFDVKKLALTRMQIKLLFFNFIKHLVQMLHAIPLN